MSNIPAAPFGPGSHAAHGTPSGFRPTGFDPSREGWQPIETAPRDCNIIGGYFNQPWCESHREGRIVQCWWQAEFDCFISSCREMQMHNGYTFEDGSTRRLHSPDREDVTHWMPLPTPPLPASVTPDARPLGRGVTSPAPILSEDR